MKDFILTRVLKFLAKKLDGYKTKIGGAGFIMVGILGMVKIMFPDIEGLPEMSLEASIASISAGITALGLAGKAEKIYKSKVESRESKRGVE